MDDGDFPHSAYNNNCSSIVFADGIAGWDVNTTRETAVYVVPGQNTATLEPRVVDRGKRYLLLVIVCSAVENFNTR